jgi:hypothetical protein
MAARSAPPGRIGHPAAKFIVGSSDNPSGGQTMQTQAAGILLLLGRNGLALMLVPQR